MRRGIVGADLDGSLEFRLRRRKIVVVEKIDIAQHGVSTNQVVIQLQRLFCRRFGGGLGFMRRRQPVLCKAPVVRISRIGQSIVRVQRNRLAKIRGSFLQAFLRVFPGVVQTLQVELIRLRILRVVFGKPFLLGSSQAQAKFIGDFS